MCLIRKSERGSEDHEIEKTWFVSEKIIRDCAVVGAQIIELKRIELRTKLFG